MLFVGPNHNPAFQLCLHANCSAAQFLMSEFNENGDLITHNIQTTNGYTRNLLQDGTVAFILAHNKGKWSDKFSAVEIIVDHVYILPTPLRPENTLSESTTIRCHHHELRLLDSNHNSRQEGATHVDQPRLIQRRLSCFLL